MARFDGEASQANPASVDADAGKLFNTIEPELDCFLNNDLHHSNILDVQMFDKTN